MKKFRKQLFFFGYMCLAVSAYAAGNADTQATLEKPPVCQGDDSYRGKVPPNFRIVRPCPSEEAERGITPTFHFAGDAIVSGEVKYGMNETLGKYAYLAIDDDSVQLLPEGFEAFDQIDVTMFNLPELDDSNNTCYSAKVKLRITSLGFILGDGIGTGSYLDGYEVLKVGNVKSYTCPNED